jgi:carbonic anhydrase
MNKTIDEILEFNRQFVAEKAYEPFITDKFPSRKLAVLTCMDTRLTELLPHALGLRNGDAKIIKNAGGLILSETDSAIRSLLVGIYELGVNEVMVVHHSTCGACHMSYDEFKPHMLESGVPEETLSEWEQKGVQDWLEGFHDTEASVRKTVAAIINHPLVPKDVTVRGFIIDSVTGELTEIL